MESALVDSDSDLWCALLDEGWPQPPVAAASPVGGTPPWLFAIRCFCIIAAAAIPGVFSAEVFPRCKSNNDVFLCVVALAGALFTGPILGFAMTMCVDSDDDAARVAASQYTRCEENVWRSVIMGVALLGIYIIYLTAVRSGGDVDRFLLAASFGTVGVGVFIGHSVHWIKGYFLRRD